MKNFFQKHLITICFFLIIITSFLLMITSAKQDSLTVDEEVHITAGYLHTWVGNYTFNSEHPPLLNDLAGLFAKIARPDLPEAKLSQFDAGDQWTYGDLFFYSSGNDVDAIIFWARLPFIFLTLGLIYLSFIWAKTVFGPKAGLMAATLVGFCPNILAHGRLATTDIGLAFFFVLTIWLLRKYILKPNNLNAILLGMSLGLVVLAKFSGIFILPVIIIGLIYSGFQKNSKISKTLGQFILIFIIAFILCWLVYAFSMRSEMGNLLTNNWVLAPINKFLQGYEILANHNKVGHWNYLNGQVNYSGWWYYFPLTLWYKLTVPALLLVAMSLIFIRKNKLFEILLIVLPLVLFLGISLTSRIDIGIRHILPVVVLLFILVSYLAETKIFILKPIVLGLVILHILAGFLAYPNFISYFNQIAGGESGGINHLDDSNLDWNQNIKRFAKYAKVQNLGKVYEYCWNQNAFSYYGVETEFLPTAPVNGVVVVCAHQLKLYKDYGYDISWVLNPPTGGPPDDIIAQTIYIWRFDLPDSASHWQAGKKNIQ